MVKDVRIDEAHHANPQAFTLGCMEQMIPGDHPLFAEHAQSLIEKLQQWAEDLDRREAQMNARLALLEHNERKMRLKEQASSLQLHEKDRSLERQRQELQNQLRRLAVGNVPASMFA